MKLSDFNQCKGIQWTWCTCKACLLAINLVFWWPWSPLLVPGFLRVLQSLKNPCILETLLRSLKLSFIHFGRWKSLNFNCGIFLKCPFEAKRIKLALRKWRSGTDGLWCKSLGFRMVTSAFASVLIYARFRCWQTDTNCTWNYMTKSFMSLPTILPLVRVSDCPTCNGHGLLSLMNLHNAW